jgi:hypothetical protein
MEAGHLCAEHMLGPKEFMQHQDSWESQFKAKMSQLLQVIIMDAVGEGDRNGTRRDKGKGKEREQARVEEEETLDVEDVEGEEDDGEEMDEESDRESEEV